MNVYWSLFLLSDTITELNFYSPENLFKRLNKDKSDLPSQHNFYLCPSFREFTKQIFVLKFPYDYHLRLDRANDYVTSDMHDQQFFNDYIRIRSIKDGLFSMGLQYVFFSEEDLEIEATGAYFSENSFTNNVRVIPGKYNIGKWIRPVEAPFIANKDCNNIKMNRGDDYLYVKFNTIEDVNLVKFNMSDSVKNTISRNLTSKPYHRTYTLMHWYDMFAESKQKKFLLNEIKNNLME